jgi:thioredoxin reductase
MLYDCAIIGGGPAGLNAALILGRARRNAILIDSNKPRNAVTQESHGFITRDGIKPIEFRQIAHKEIGRYPSVKYKEREITSVIKNKPSFELVTSEGERYHHRYNKPNNSDYYGKTIAYFPKLTNMPVSSINYFI